MYHTKIENRIELELKSSTIQKELQILWQEVKKMTFFVFRFSKCSMTAWQKWAVNDTISV